jgi:hypothetical protein
MKKNLIFLVIFLVSFIGSGCSYNRYEDENFTYYKMKVSDECVYAVTGLTEIGKTKDVLIFPVEYNEARTYIKNSNLGPGSGKINSSNLKLFLPKEFTYVREDYFRFIYDEKNVNGTNKLIILSNDPKNLDLSEVKNLKNIFVSNQIYNIDNIDNDNIIAIDASITKYEYRLNRIQITDETGIMPGAGVGRKFPMVGNKSIKMFTLLEKDLKKVMKGYKTCQGMKNDTSDIRKISISARLLCEMITDVYNEVCAIETI